MDRWTDHRWMGMHVENKRTVKAWQLTACSPFQPSLPPTVDIYIWCSLDRLPWETRQHCIERERDKQHKTTEEFSWFPTVAQMVLFPNHLLRPVQYQWPTSRCSWKTINKFTTLTEGLTTQTLPSSQKKYPSILPSVHPSNYSSIHSLGFTSLVFFLGLVWDPISLQ